MSKETSTPERRPEDTRAGAALSARAETNTDAAPIFRVIEVVRDERGRLREEGRIWHTDIAHLRRFGRAVAANTASHRVVVADAAGQVLEEIPVAAPHERVVRWDDWQDISLPPLPPRSAQPEPRRRPKPASTVTPAAVPPRATTPPALDGAMAALQAAADTAAQASSPTRAGPAGDGADVELP